MSTTKKTVTASLGGLAFIIVIALLASHCGKVPEQQVEPYPPPPPPSSVTLSDKVIGELEWGKIAFNAPSAMRFGEAQQLELLLSPALSVEQLQAQLVQKAGVEAASVRIANRMAAQLEGDGGFTITSASPKEQAITTDQTTRWVWAVTPTRSGSRRLYLTLSALVDVAGQNTPLVVRSFDRTIVVAITIPQRIAGFVRGNWQWLWATILVPVAGYLWRRGKKRGSGGEQVWTP
jgi:hypothetical protein